MNTREKLIKARLGMLALAEELQNISLACTRAGISRTSITSASVSITSRPLTHGSTALLTSQAGLVLGNKLP